MTKHFAINLIVSFALIMRSSRRYPRLSKQMNVPSVSKISNVSVGLMSRIEKRTDAKRSVSARYRKSALRSWFGILEL